jgi:hypothetical protein
VTGFHPGDSWLIGISFAGVVLFSFGLLRATALNDEVVVPFVAVHALWHLVGAFAFIGL